MLWVDKHRPTSLEKLSYHDALSTRLADIVSRSPAHLFLLTRFAWPRRHRTAHHPARPSPLR